MSSGQFDKVKHVVKEFLPGFNQCTNRYGMLTYFTLDHFTGHAKSLKTKKTQKIIRIPSLFLNYCMEGPEGGILFPFPSPNFD